MKLLPSSPKITTRTLSSFNDKMATVFQYDPNWVKTTVSDCWNFLVSQLGHWNKLKIIAMDHTMYERLGAPVLEGLRAEAM